MAEAKLPPATEPRMLSNPRASHSHFQLRRFLLSGCGSATPGALAAGCWGEGYWAALWATLADSGTFYPGHPEIQFGLQVSHFVAAVRGTLAGSFGDATSVELISQPTKFKAGAKVEAPVPEPTTKEYAARCGANLAAFVPPLLHAGVGGYM